MALERNVRFGRFAYGGGCAALLLLLRFRLSADLPSRSVVVRNHGRDRAGHMGRDDAEHRYADWFRVHVGLTTFLEETRRFRGLPSPAADDGAALLLRGERAFLVLDGAHLIEPRPTGGRFVGGTPGVWVTLAGGLRCEVGRTGGTFVPGTDQPTSVDVGGLVVTDRRVVLCGTAEQREWLFANVVAVHHDPDAPWTARCVSDPATISGFSYGHADVPLVRFRLMLVMAVHAGSLTELRGELEAAIARHLGERPPLP